MPCVRSHLFSAFLLASCLFALVSCVAQEVSVETTWDLSTGRAKERVNWGAEGWEVVDNGKFSEQFNGPVALAILLSEGRRIEGTFAIARVVREGQLVRSVSLRMLPCSAKEAYTRVKGLLDGLRAPAKDHGRLDRWYAAGPAGGPGEQIIFNFLESWNPPILGVDIDWVWASTSNRNWVVSVGFFWDDYVLDLSGLHIEREGERVETEGLSSIAETELSVELSVGLPEDAARRLLRSITSDVVWSKARPKAGQLLHHGDRSYRLIQARRGMLLLRPLSDDQIQ